MSDELLADKVTWCIKHGFNAVQLLPEPEYVLRCWEGAQYDEWPEEIDCVLVPARVVSS